MTKDEALKLALEALEYIRNIETDVASQTKYGQAEEVIREALAQPEQEPFGHVTVRRLSQRFENHHDQFQFYPAGQSPYLDNVDECYVVYTTPPQRKPPQFPTMLRKMWSGTEVQEWINENWNNT